MPTRLFKRTILLMVLAIASMSLQGCGLLEIFGDALAQACELPEFNPTKFEDTNDGVCSATDCSLREAIITANACPGDDVINLMEGSYTTSLTGTPTYPSEFGALEITENVTINGGTSVVEGGDIQVSGSGTVVSITDLQFRRMRNEGAATLTDVTVEAIYNEGELMGSDLDVVDGIGIFNSGTLEITGGNVLRNSSSGRCCEPVGIVQNDDGTMILTDLLVAENSARATDEPGYLPVIAISNHNGILELNRVVIRDNNRPQTAVATWGDISTRALLREVLITGHDGFAVVNSFSPLEIIDSTIRDNPGGALFVDVDSEVIIRRSLIAGNGNEALLSGACGTILNSGRNLRIENSTLSGNHDSGAGCAVIENWTNLHLISSTLFGNALPAILDQPDWTPTSRIEGSIIARNSGGNCVSTVINSLGSNLFDDSTCLPDTAAGDLVDTVGTLGILSLADNGGPTWTHALEASSLAVDGAGESCLTSDQRGISRPQGPRCDIGAFELERVGTGMTSSPEETEPTPSPVPAASIPTPPGPITINFNADNYSILAGECTRLRWDVKNADQVTLEGESVPALEAEQVCPKVTTTYWLMAENAGGQEEAFVTIEVTEPVVVPKAPAQLTITNQDCTAQSYTVTLGWIDAADNEDGYRIYRDGALIATIGSNAKAFSDDPPYGGPYTYGVESFNSSGSSSRPTVEEAGCIY